MLRLLVNNLPENASQKGKMDKILALSALCNFYMCYMKNVLVFSQSDAHDFLMYIIRSVMRMFVLKCMFDFFFSIYHIFRGWIPSLLWVQRRRLLCLCRYNISHQGNPTGSQII